MIAVQSGMAGSVQIWTEMSSLCCLTLLAVKSPLDDNNKVLDNLISCPKSFGSLLLEAYNSSYG